MVSSKAKMVSIVFRAELIARRQNENPARCHTGGVSGTLSQVPHELLLRGLRLENTWARQRFPEGSARRFALTEFFDERG
jgi:hypothetical protein